MNLKRRNFGGKKFWRINQSANFDVIWREFILAEGWIMNLFWKS